MRLLGMAFLLLFVAAQGCSTDSPAGNGGGAGGTGGDLQPGGSGDGAGGSGGTGGEGGVICLRPATRTVADRSRERVIYHHDGGDLRRVHGAFVALDDDPEAAARSVLAGFAPDVDLSIGEGELVLSSVKRGLVGRYLRFRQLRDGYPVFDREVVIHVVDHEERLEVRDLVFGHARLGGFRAPEPMLDAREAIDLAHLALDLNASPTIGSEATVGIYVEREEPVLAFGVEVSPDSPVGSFLVFVDALDGTILEIRDRLQFVEGTGLVFDPNPMASTGNTSLRDNDDQTSPALDAARFRVTLPRLDGSGYLRGEWVDARSLDFQTRTMREDLVFDFDRSQIGFEETTAYFQLDRMQARLQGLGFLDHNSGRQVVYANGSTDENSWFDPRFGSITLGTGGVDDGEDADVMLHEYGHAILDDIASSFGRRHEGGAIGEGFGDYLATSTAARLSPQLLDPACLGEWDGAAFMSSDPPCMRRVDGTKHYPEHMDYQVHSDGEIWSSALWELRESIGGDAADLLIFESLLSYVSTTTFRDGVAALLDADRNLNGGRNLTLIRRILYRTGLLRELTPSAAFPDVISTVPVSVENVRQYGTYLNWTDDWQEIRQPGAPGLRLHFAKIETELDSSCDGGACDNIYLYDGAGSLFQILNGNRTMVTSVVIPGEVVRIRLVTDPWVAHFGYLVDRVEVMGHQTCGNGQLDGGEACDGTDLGGQSCESLGYGPGPLGCRPDCTLDATDCPGSGGCGDGFAGPGEECDGADLNDASCASMGFTGGSLSCTGGCKLDTSACTTCGDGVREGFEACDGDDLGGASCADLGEFEGTPTCSDACTIDMSSCTPIC